MKNPSCLLFKAPFEGSHSLVSIVCRVPSVISIVVTPDTQTTELIIDNEIVSKRDTCDFPYFATLFHVTGTVGVLRSFLGKKSAIYGKGKLITYHANKVARFQHAQAERLALVLTGEEGASS